MSKASTAKASATLVLGAMLAISCAVRVSKGLFFYNIRLKSPSVIMPIT